MENKYTDLFRAKPMDNWGKFDEKRVEEFEAFINGKYLLDENYGAVLDIRKLRYEFVEKGKSDEIFNSKEFDEFTLNELESALMYQKVCVAFESEQLNYSLAEDAGVIGEQAYNLGIELEILRNIIAVRTIKSIEK